MYALELEYGSRSLHVHPEDYGGAVDGLVCESVRGPVVEVGVPQALGGHAQPLTLHLPIKHLHADLVSGDLQLFHSRSDLLGEVIRHLCALGCIEGGALEPLVEDLLDDGPRLAGVKALVLLRFQLVSVHSFRHGKFQLSLFKFQIISSRAQTHSTIQPNPPNASLFGPHGSLELVDALLQPSVLFLVGVEDLDVERVVIEYLLVLLLVVEGLLVDFLYLLLELVDLPADGG